MSFELSNNTEYKSWILSIKKQIKTAQIKASIAVNEEMLLLYWTIGKDICEKHFDSQYGSSFFENLSKDLRHDFPNAQGFSVTNLKYMKRFYLFYKENRHQLGDDFNNIIFTIPWRHYIEIFTRAHSVDEALQNPEKEFLRGQNGISKNTSGDNLMPLTKEKQQTASVKMNRKKRKYRSAL